MTDTSEEQYKELHVENSPEAPRSREETDLFSVLPREEETLPEEEGGNGEAEILRELPEEEKKEEPPAPFKVMEEEYTEVSQNDFAAKELPQKEEKELPAKEKPAEEIRPVRKKAEKRTVNLARLSGGTLGELLAAARKEQGMTTEDVAKSTLIREDYIRALEQDDLKKLPPAIFVRAYVRSLGSLYALDEASMQMLQEHLSSLEPAANVPEKVVDELQRNMQVNEEEARKVRLTCYYLLGGLAALLLLIISLTVYFTLVREKKDPAAETSSAAAQKSAVPAKKFDPSGIDSLIPQVIPEEQLLPLPGKKKSAR